MRPSPYFYPGAGQLGVMLNGDAVAEPLVRFAAVFRRLRVYVVVCDIRCIDRDFYHGSLFLAGAGYYCVDDGVDDCRQWQ